MVKNLCIVLMGTTALITAHQALGATSNAPLPGFTDGAPVVLTGVINEIRPDEFDMNYGTGAVTVELDNWKWTGNETKYLTPGDKITVSGKIDDDLFDGRKIQADNLYLQSSHTYYYTNDSYPSYYMTQTKTPADGSYVSMRGTVSSVSGQEFTLTGANNASMRVNASSLDYNPFDDEGVKVKTGDRVYVYGQINDDFFENREIMADSLVMLSKAGL